MVPTHVKQPAQVIHVSTATNGPVGANLFAMRFESAANVAAKAEPYPNPSAAHLCHSP